jgi:hypothetical protein
LVIYGGVNIEAISTKREGKGAAVTKTNLMSIPYD